MSTKTALKLVCQVISRSVKFFGSTEGSTAMLGMSNWMPLNAAISDMEIWRVVEKKKTLQLESGRELQFIF